MKKIEVKDLNENKRIDKFLSESEDLSRSKVQKLIEIEHVKVNDKVVKNNYVVKNGDVVEFDSNYEEDTTVKEEQMDLDIYYEDEYLLVVNKPSGMVVHPAPGHYSGTLVNGLLGHTNLSDVDENRPGIVHRIDKDTSGLLMVAKTEKIHEALSQELQKHKAVRKYIALVSGVIHHETGTIDAPIGRDPLDRKKMTVTDINAKEAITHFKVLERYKDATLIECSLETGRTHQIRVHMKYIGHPIINDLLYGKKKIDNDYGQMLHAKTLGFIHPITKEYLEFTSPLPEEFESILENYKN